MIVVGLHGLKTAGKNTASEFIVRWAAERGVHVVQRGFADLLKLSAYRIFDPNCTLAEAVAWADEIKFTGHVEVYLEPDDSPGAEDRAAKPINFVTGREFLQQYGTEAHRDVFGDNFWVDQLLPFDELARIRAVTKFDAYHDDYRYPEICCVTDLRFANEAERIRDPRVGGIVARIDRPMPDDGDKHASEKPLADRLVDYAIRNTGDLYDFECAVRKFADKVIEPRLGKE